MRVIISVLALLTVSISNLIAQDSTNKKVSLHWQATTVTQYHPDIKSPYQGLNSLQASEPAKTSLTSTFYLNYSPAKNTYFIFNPEMTGGEGLSKTTGIAGFTNGEVYRIGDPKPHVYIARLYAEQRIALSSRKEFIADDQNQIQERTSQDYFSVIAGKFSLTDFFDDSQISHDPRTQFLNWSLMGNGGWDYPANTRGYTMGVVLQFVYKDWGIRTAMTAMPTEANGPTLEWKYNKAMGTVLEVEKTHIWKKNSTSFGTFHFGIYNNIARMGSYEDAIKSGSYDVTQSRLYGRSKTGFYTSLDNHFGKHHWFIKGSYNDGKNETWAFTEIDNSIASGYSFDGFKGKHRYDALGIAFVSNGLSNLHKEYLAGGGYGFIIGDGKLNYNRENILEIYYSLSIKNKLYISPDYQLVVNPAYNSDRGPVHVFSVRLHLAL